MLIGISIFYLVLFRLIWKLINPSPKPWREFFKGQNLIAKTTHYLLYLSIFTITISGVALKNFIWVKS